MKKLFTMVAAALMSVAMMAGENDLLWDYTEAAPSANPDKGLTYGSKVDDGEKNQNNHLNGVKMNGSGYCYFTKAAVAGKLKLTFGPRSGSSATSLDVYTWAGETASAETKIGTTGSQTECATQIVDLTDAQNNIYIKRSGSVETVLQKIEFKEDVARTFVDFKIEFRDNPYTVIEPMNGELPAGVTVTGTTYNGGQHGVQGGVITVPVDGTVKFTIGACNYSNGVINVKKDGVDYATISNKAACGEQKPNYNQFVVWNYLGEAGTLTFEIGSSVYVPYFFAEAAEITPCEIIFKDQNGAELGRVATIEGATLDTIPYTEADLPAFPVSTERFRGWFYSNGKKAKVGDPINGNTTIQAKVTPVEHATVGSIQTYDFTKEIFYPEDHETIEMDGGYYHDGQHGWAFKNGEGFLVEVAGKKAIIVLEICQYGTADAVWKASYLMQEPVVITPDSCAAIGAEGEQITLKYTYPEGRITYPILFTLQNTGGENYLHKVTVYNVEDFPEKDEETGYYMVPSGDAAAFILTLAQAQEGDKIFLPNGTYDLGETVLTTISKNNISIIGQSMWKTIIRNAPDAKTESIDKTATLRIAKNVTGTYLQDLTIQNALDYYKNDNGRAVALWDQGTKTVCKNVKLLSYQDTYYSNLQGAVKYFEDCEIHGTVDFICGDGSVYFKNNLLYAEKRKKDGGGSDALTANNGIASDRGYVFEGCTIKSECPTVSFGRAWNNKPTTTFLNTLVDYEAGQFSFSDGDKIQRWTKELMNANAWPRFGEYNTHLEDGTILTPEHNQVTFVDPKSGNATQTLETVLTADEAAVFTMEYTLGDWAATARSDAEQLRRNVLFDEPTKTLSWNPTNVGVYMVCVSGVPYITTETSFEITDIDEVIAAFHAMYGDDLEPIGGYYVRFANGRGGFGPEVYAGDNPESIENTNAEAAKVQKVFRNGQLIIIKNNNEYNVLGGLVK